MNPSVLARFWSKVEKTDGCWLWRGNLASGYGHFSLTHDKSVKAHRFSYEVAVGEIPPGMTIDHVRARGCVSRACVNPQHLEAVTARTNTLRGDGVTAVNARKTVCIRGHKLEGDNVYLYRNLRACRTCKRADARRSATRRRAAIAYMTRGAR